MPEYERSEVASSNKKQKVTSEGFYSWDERRKRHNPAQILKMRSRPLNLYSTVGYLERSAVLNFNDDCASSQASEALAKWQK